LGLKQTEDALGKKRSNWCYKSTGKLRGQIRVAKDAERATIEQLCAGNDQVQKFVAGQTVKKVVVGAGRFGEYRCMSLRHATNGKI